MPDELLGHRQPHTSARYAPLQDDAIGSRLTADVIEAAANLATDGIAVTGDAFGSAAYLTELIPIYVNRALAQIAVRGREEDDNGHDRRT